MRAKKYGAARLSGYTVYCSDILYIESEKNYVAVLHDIFLSL